MVSGFSGEQPRVRSGAFPVHDSAALAARWLTGRAPDALLASGE
jgi:hypothetical protein